MSWRWLFVVGIPPLLLVSFLRRRLPESRRFDRGAGAGPARRTLARDLRPERAAVVDGSSSSRRSSRSSSQQASTFTIDFLETDRGMSVTAANFMLVFAGLPGIPIMVVAGALSDRYGRRHRRLRVRGWPASFGGDRVLLVARRHPGAACRSCRSRSSASSARGRCCRPTRRSCSRPGCAARPVRGPTSRASSVALRASRSPRRCLTITSQSVTATLLGIGPLIAIVMFAVVVPRHARAGARGHDRRGSRDVALGPALTATLRGHGASQRSEVDVYNFFFFLHLVRRRRLRRRLAQRAVRRAGQEATRSRRPGHRRGQLLRDHKGRRRRRSTWCRCSASASSASATRRGSSPRRG